MFPQQNIHYNWDMTQGPGTLYRLSSWYQENLTSKKVWTLLRFNFSDSVQARWQLKNSSLHWQNTNLILRSWPLTAIYITHQHNSTLIIVFLHHDKTEFHYLSNEITKLASAQIEPPAANFPTPLIVRSLRDQSALALPKPSSKIAKQISLPAKTNPTTAT